MRRRLSITVPFGNDEDILGYASRVAHANHGRGLREFCSDLGLSYLGLRQDEDAAVAELMALCGLPRDQWLPNLLTRVGTYYDVNGERMSRNTFRRTPLRYCPLCFEEDTHASGPRRCRPYRRLHWQCQSIRTCLVHHVALLSAAPSPAAISHDFVLAWDRERARPDSKMVLVDCAPTAFEHYLHHRIWRKKPGNEWIDGLPMYVAERLCDLVGATVLHGLVFSQASFSLAERQSAAQAGYDILSNGLAAFIDFLKSLHEPFLNKGGPAGGPAVYGQLYKSLAHKRVTDTGYTEIRDVMKRTALENLPFGPGDEFFGPVTNRSMHSVYTISKEYGLHHKTVRGYLRLADAIDVENPRKNHRELVSVTDVEKLFGGIEDALSWSDAMEYVGADRTFFTLIAKGGYVPIVSRQVGDRRVKSFFARPALDAFLHKVAAHETVTDYDPSEYTPIRRVAKVAKSTQKAALDALLGGNLKLVAVDPSQKGLESILVNIDEIRELAGIPSVDGVSAQQAAVELQTTNMVVFKLMELGFLAFVKMLNPVTGLPQRTIRTEELARFKRQYISTYLFAKEKEMSFWTASDFLKGAEVSPAILGSLVGATFYRRADLF